MMFHVTIYLTPVLPKCLGMCVRVVNVIFLDQTACFVVAKDLKFLLIIVNGSNGQADFFAHII